jgi:hypothetical protein
MKRAFTVIVALLLASAAQMNHLHAASPAILNAGSVKVTVNYKGKGTVDAAHKVWVYVFDSPDIGAGSVPIDMTTLDKNGTVASFEVGSNQVWIAVAFDEKGIMNGDGPPPTGSPIGILMLDGKPQPVTPGEKGTVTLTFDDTLRMP